MSRAKLRLVAALVRAERADPGLHAPRALAILDELRNLYRSPFVRPLDRRVTRALALMRAALADPWTVSLIAQRVGMSRAAFARHFVAALGVAPRAYLQSERIRRAAVLLVETDQSLAEVAIAVGYRSEFAFARAFKRLHGIAPGGYRRRATMTMASCARLAA